MYENYIFDLYGTLIDIHTDESSKNFFKKYAKWLRKQGLYFDWKHFYRLYTSIERKYRDNAAQAQETSNPEIQIEGVFYDVFAAKGYVLTEEQIKDLCESFRRISLITLRLFPDTIACLE